jgi:hypothetical protein
VPSDKNNKVGKKNSDKTEEQKFIEQVLADQFPMLGVSRGIISISVISILMIGIIFINIEWWVISSEESTSGRTQG